MHQKDIATGVEAAYLNGDHLVAGTGTVAGEKRNPHAACNGIMDGAIAVCFHHNREGCQGGTMVFQCAFDAPPSARTGFSYDEGFLGQLFQGSTPSSGPRMVEGYH